MEVVFKKAYISKGINVDGENLTNLSFADDFCSLQRKKKKNKTKKPTTKKQTAKHLNSLNSESLKVGLKIHEEKAKYMTSHVDSEYNTN